jgi:hypothetical protein
VCMCVHVCACVCMCVHVCACVCMCVHVCVGVCAHERAGMAANGWGRARQLVSGRVDVPCAARCWPARLATQSPVLLPPLPHIILGRPPPKQHLPATSPPVDPTGLSGGRPPVTAATAAAAVATAIAQGWWSLRLPVSHSRPHPPPSSPTIPRPCRPTTDPGARHATTATTVINSSSCSSGRRRRGRAGGARPGRRWGCCPTVPPPSPPRPPPPRRPAPHPTPATA